MTTGTLDTTANIDNRVFTSEGRNSIVNEHKDLKENTIMTLKDMSVAAITTIGLLWGGIEYAYSYILNEEKPNIIIDNEKNKIMFTKNIFASNILGVDGAITLGNIQLYYNKNNPYKIVAPYSTTDHGLMQAIGRDGGKGVSLNVILDSVRNPQRIIYQQNGGIKYVGKYGCVVLNKFGKIITTFGKARMK